jgi:hypothetical protein
MSDKESGWLDLLLEFISKLKIDSKETGGQSPLILYGSQKRFLAEVCDGLDRGIHHFVNLKARQLGISTISLAIDLFWLSVHPGLQGALVTDTEGNRNKFRIILERYLESLPGSYRIGVKKSNRDNLVLSNGSVLDYIVAGKKQSATDIARGRAYNFLHATEVANYGSQEGIVSLFATLAEKNPDRLYIFESTAKGFNLFWNLYRQAVDDPLSQKAFFIGWWANEQYALDDNDPNFTRYWDGTLSEDEQEKINDIRERYNVQITPNQLAWYRWKQETRIGVESMMEQEYPWTDDEAFIQTGSAFFPAKKIGRMMVDLDSSPPPFKAFVYEMSENFMQTKITPVDEADAAELKIWEEPSEIGRYVAGIDPAYGRSENQDRSVVSVWRCYSDKFVQVAEYATPRPETYQVAWVMAHLAGAYKNIMLNVEISGPGNAIMPELRHLKQLLDAGVMPSPGGAGVDEIFGNVRWYLYHREDSTGAGLGFYNWQTNLSNKAMGMNQLRDSISIDLVEIRSVRLVSELQTIVQDGLNIEAGSRAFKDDRVMAAMLAHAAWIKWVRPSQVENKETFAEMMKAEAERSGDAQASMVSYIVSDFFKSQQQQREQEQIDDAWR